MIKIKKFLTLILAGGLMLSDINVSAYANTHDNIQNDDAIDVIEVDPSKHEYNPGCIPVETEVASYKYKKGEKADLKSSLPAKYEPDINQFPEVRNQNPYGTCWAFSTVGLAEFSVLKNENRMINLSELQTSYFMYNGSNLDPLGGTEGDSYSAPTPEKYLSQGGNLTFSTRMLWSFKGLSKEDDVPYGYAKNSLIYGVPKEYGYYSNEVQLQDAYYINIKENPEIVKEMVTKYGSVGISYYANGYFNHENNCQYYNIPTPVNHSVNIVGWDDNFAKEKFGYGTESTMPAGDGAWLIRNSWGDNSYSASGYFWLSYYDKTIDDEAYAYNAVSKDSNNYYDNNYQYDGSVASWEEKFGESQVKMANVFVAQKERELLKAVSFECFNTGASYTVDIYKNLSDTNNPASGNHIANATTKGTTTVEGIYTVELAEAVELKKGDSFSVIITLKAASGDTAAVVYEGSVNYYWILAKCSAKSGESFIVRDGKWEDFGKERDANLRIKAFTNDVDYKTVDVSGVDIVCGDSIEIRDDEKTYIMASKTPVNATNQEIVWSSQNKDVAEVSKQGQIIPTGAGITTVSATSADGKASDSITVKVIRTLKSFYFDSNSDICLKPGESYQLEYTEKPVDSDEHVIWETTDSEVATVDDKGNVTAVGVGGCYVVMRHPNDTDWYEEKYVNVTEDGVVDPNAARMKNLEGFSANIEDTIFTYAQGKPIEPKLKNLSYGDMNLLEDTYKNCYSITYVDNVNAGTAHIIISAVKGNKYVTGKKIVPFEIKKINQENSLDFDNYKVTVGKSYQIKIKGAIGELSATSSNENVLTVDSSGIITVHSEGYSFVTIQAMGDENYEKGMKFSLYLSAYNPPTAAKSFKTEITSSGIKLTWKKADRGSGYYVYRDGKKLKTIDNSYSQSMSYIDKSVKNGKAYSYKIITYSDSVEDIDTTNTLTQYYLSTPKISSVKNSSNKKMTVKWGKISSVSGYQLQYSTSSTFKKAVKTVTIKSYKTTSKSISSLRKKSKYYIRIRTYKTVSGKKVYSLWSSKKTVTIKK